MDIAAQFGDNLVRSRKLAYISQDELSVRASVHRTEISQLERGLRIPRIDTLVKLCVSLEVEPSELLEGIRWSPGDRRIGNFRSPEMSEQRNEGGRGVAHPEPGSLGHEENPALAGLSRMPEEGLEPPTRGL